MITKNEQSYNTKKIFQNHGFESAIKYAMQEPDWEFSETLVSKSWKNHLLTFQYRLLIADGAYAFQEKVISNLRTRIRQLEAELKTIKGSNEIY